MQTEMPAVRPLLAILACLAAVFVGSVIFTGVEFLGQDAKQAATTGMVRPIVGRLPLHWTLSAVVSLFGVSVLAGLAVYGRESHGRWRAGGDRGFSGVGGIGHGNRGVCRGVVRMTVGRVAAGRLAANAATPTRDGDAVRSGARRREDAANPASRDRPLRDCPPGRSRAAPAAPFRP